MITLVTGFHLGERDGDYWMPKCHDHPRDQSAWGLEIAKSETALRIVTNSEHIFNGMRVAVAVDDAPHFAVEYIEESGEVTRLTMNEFGVFKNWPRGMFDQGAQDSRDILRAQMERRKARDAISSHRLGLLPPISVSIE